MLAFQAGNVDDEPCMGGIRIGVKVSRRCATRNLHKCSFKLRDKPLRPSKYLTSSDAELQIGSIEGYARLHIYVQPDFQKWKRKQKAIG